MRRPSLLLPVAGVAIATCLLPLLAVPASALTFDTIYVDRVDTHNAVIVWSTDTVTSGQIEYGLTTATASQLSLVLDQDAHHQTLLFGLPEGEDHVCRITARGAGTKIQSGWLPFRTRGIPMPKVINAGVSALAKDGGTLTWTSNVPVKGIFECGYDTAYGIQKAEDRFSPYHEITVTRFYPRERVFYRIRGTDDRGYVMPERRGEFVTMEDNIAVRAKVDGTFIRNPEPGFVRDTPPILDRVTDGILNYFTGMATSGDPAGDTQWVQIDLGSVNLVGQILTYWRQLAYPMKFSVQGSIDGVRWMDFGDTFDAGAGSSARSQSGDPMWEHVVNVRNLVLRYIRVDVPQGAPYYKRFDNYRFVQMFELKVYPPAISRK